MGDPDIGHQQQDERQRMRIVPFVFLRPRLRVAHTVQNLWTAHHWTPRIDLRFLERVLEKREAMVKLGPERNFETRIREREQMVVRLTTDRKRTEDARLTVTPASTPAFKNLAVPAANMAARPADMKLNRAPEVRDSREREKAECSPSPGQRAPAAAPLDVNKLTDQVMRQIDHKLQAHRERMWRK